MRNDKTIQIELLTTIVNYERHVYRSTSKTTDDLITAFNTGAYNPSTFTNQLRDYYAGVKSDSLDTYMHTITACSNTIDQILELQRLLDNWLPEDLQNIELPDIHQCIDVYAEFDRLQSVLSKLEMFDALFDMFQLSKSHSIASATDNVVVFPGIKAQRIFTNQ